MHVISMLFLAKLKNAPIKAFLTVFGNNLFSLVLFGSYVRKEPKHDSNVDVLVVLDVVSDRYELQKTS